MGKNKVIYYSFMKDDPTSWYRIHSVLPYIKSDKYELVSMSDKSTMDWSVFVDAKVFIFQRPCDGNHVNLIRLAKDMGVKVILDYDDDCLHLDMYNPMFGYYNYNRSNVIECIMLADEVWVSTGSIKKSYLQHNKNIHVIPNCHNDYIFPVKDKMPFNRDSNVAMYRGGQSHEGDLYEVGVAENIVKVINRNKNWNFRFYGHRFTFLEMRCGENYHAIEGSTTVQFFKKMYKENPAIFFYPLTNNRFNQGKSNISFIEATYAGAAFFGNKNLNEFNKDCIIDFDLFEEGLVNSLSTELLERANTESWEYIQEHLLLSKVNEIRDKRILANL